MHSQSERLRDSRDLSSDPAGSNNRDRLARQLATAEATPGALPLHAVKLAETLLVVEQHREHKLGERFGMNAAGGGDDQVTVGDTETMNVLADARGGGLHPLQARRKFERTGVFRCREIPEHLGTAQQASPFGFPFGCSRPARRA